MALTNYTTLQAAVNDWLHRSDLATQVVDFIALAEAEINTELRMRLMESDETLSVSSGARTVALPSRYIDPISLELVISGQQNTPLTFRLPQDLAVNASAGAATRPQYWTINGSNIEFPEPVDDNYTFNFRMLKGFDIASTATNSLLTKYPGIYLFGSLLQAAPYMRDLDKVALWQNSYDKALSKANKSESRARRVNSLTTDLPSAGQFSNIFTG